MFFKLILIGKMSVQKKGVESSKRFKTIVDDAHKKAKSIAWAEEDWSFPIHDGVEHYFCPSCQKKIEKATIKTEKQL